MLHWRLGKILSALTLQALKIREWLPFGVMPIAGFYDPGTKQNPIKNDIIRRAKPSGSIGITSNGGLFG